MAGAARPACGPKTAQSGAPAGDGPEGVHWPTKGTKRDYCCLLIPFLERGRQMLSAWEVPQATAPGGRY